MMIDVLTKKACVKKRVCSLKPVSKENSPKVHKKMTQNQNQKKNREKKIHVRVLSKKKKTDDR
jgi:hypothetical protein